METKSDISKEKTQAYLDEHYESWFVKGLSEFVRIPNLTPMVDKEYLTNGLLEKAMDLVDDYINQLKIEGIKKTIIRPENTDPLIVYVVESNQKDAKNVLLYGHLDKQPWFTGWDEGLSPTDPVIRGDLMYGRGSSDDGYSPFACMMAVKIGQLQGVPMPRVALVLETAEESGSPNLVKLLDQAKDVILKPDILICMDSGCLDYEQLWMTSSLRGICMVDFTVEFGKVGYHSGETGGIIPETFRILRTILDKLDNNLTGEVTKALQVEVPEFKRKEAKFIAEKYGSALYTKYNVVEGGKFVDQDNIEELYLNNVWRPNLSITGAEGLPPIASAGNVLRPKTSVRASMRLCPAFKAPEALEIMKKIITENVPYNAKVEITGSNMGNGWSMNELEPWFLKSIQQAGADFFGAETGSYGEGGSIPFLNELGTKFPEAQIIALGLLGPHSNAHGPNECINLKYAKKLIGSLTHIIASCGKPSQ